ncbi:conserved hypothetical protein [Denitrovibrio acetiphilus DSM 12809]|uniref:DUF2914 domain-containing protein n=1 Tax=Denitrovibrio acetiphilus (strain DSM 12809 / NBRC 114555 / N2460) TaxID=522772 RepID=D4H0J7_DENA2|nr:DUF2914 domain-containing protein [Denitrovibrio acetiphilus]ADD68510.1 conserved hypothetical protein [Denitrovibrio acetiphilus DSM 12809]
MRLLLLIVFATLFTLAGAIAETSVSRITMTTDVTNREPVDSAVEFKNDIGRLFCYTEIEADEYPTEVTHIWIYDKNIEAEIKLPVKSPKWRTYSSKAILPEWTGNWKVEVYSEDGKLIDSVDFKINE